MNHKQSNIKIIFGLKARQLRLEKEMSFDDLSKLTSISVSYLNEIEKGKKYPKEDKIHLLAKALGTNFDELVSPELTDSLAPLGELLKSNFLNELPDGSKVPFNFDFVITEARQGGARGALLAERVHMIQREPGIAAKVVIFELSRLPQ